MSWTVACFCGNVYSTPPDQCDICGRSVDELPASTIRSRITDDLAADELGESGGATLAQPGPTLGPWNQTEHGLERRRDP